MNYSQLREEITKECSLMQLEGWTVADVVPRFMTAIDTYLEEKAVEVQSKAKYPTFSQEWRGFKNAAAIIRSKE